MKKGGVLTSHMIMVAESRDSHYLLRARESENERRMCKLLNSCNIILLICFR